MIQKVKIQWATLWSNPIYFVAAFYLSVAGAAAVNAQHLIFQPDAYYYFTVARNLAAGEGLTFDGISVTTGFHPLWLGIVTVIYYLSDSVQWFQNTIYGLQTVLFIAGHALLTRVALRLGISLRAFLLLSAPVFIAHLNVFQSGLENTLSFFLIALLLWLQYQLRPRGLGATAIIAFVLVLIYFARLDGIFLLVFYVPMYLVSQLRDRNFVSAFALPAIVGASVLTHWLVMLLAFDTIYSTSQMAISHFLSGSPSILQSFSVADHPVSQRITALAVAASGDRSSFVGYIGLVIPASLLLSLYILVRENAAARAPLIAVCLMAIAQLIYYALFLDGWFQPWYFMAWFITVAFAGGFLFSSILSRLTMMRAALLLVVAVVAILVVDVQRPNLGWTYFAERAEMLRDYQTDGTVLVGWTPDLASFYSGVPIRHLEGLMNSYEYLRTYVLPGKVASYVAEIGATHFVVSGRAVLPEYFPCLWKIAKDADSGLTAYGIYDNHNSYIAVYEIEIGEEQPMRFTGNQDKTCGPAKGP